MHALLNPANIVEWLANWGTRHFRLRVHRQPRDSVPEETVMLVRVSRRPRDPRPQYVYLVCVISAVSGDCCAFSSQARRAKDLCSPRNQILDHPATLRTAPDVLPIRTAARQCSWAASSPAYAHGGADGRRGGMPSWRFRMEVLGAILWCMLVVTIGYLVGDEVYRINGIRASCTAMDPLAALLLCFVFWFFGAATGARP